MIRFKDINIPKPCSVDYDSLPYDEVKRFCNSCKKHVYDFRDKDEIYLNSIINTHGKGCGIFYKDEIQSLSLKTQRPFHYAFVTKLFAIVLFIKTLLSSYHTQASSLNIQTTTQHTTDSTGIDITFKKRPSPYTAYSLEIFINGNLYKSGTNLDDGTGSIWLPDSLKENDKIKITIKKYDHNGRYKIRSRSYNFKFKESEKITIKVSYKRNREIHLFKRRRPVAVGYY